MAESAQDLIGVLLGLVALWFLVGALIKQDRLWDARRGANGRRHSVAGRWQKNRMAGQ
jgi:hypothetical protein